MKKPRIDYLILLLALLLAVAMALTLLYGKEFSRHGYGAMKAHAPAFAEAGSGSTYGPPLRIGNPFCAQA